jgi:hypothetical protein
LFCKPDKQLLGFNIFMIVWIVSGLSAVSKMQTHSQAEQIGAGIGTALGLSAVGALWLFGVIILGIFVLLTRGNTVIIEERSASGSGGAFQSYAPADFSRADDRIAEMIAQKNRTPAAAAPVSGGFGKRR